MKYKHRRHPKSYVAMEAARLNPIFTSLCGLQTRPQVTFERTTLKLLKKSKYVSPRLMGMAFRHKNWIWLSPNQDMNEVRDTLAHEFIHFRFPYLYHGSKFTDYVKRLLKGEQFKPYKPRKA